MSLCDECKTCICANTEGMCSGPGCSHPYGACTPPAPVDWPARFRAAAELERLRGWTHTAAELEDIARGPGYVAETVGRALSGE